MDVFQAIILGLIQGVAEWLPISSSGHLALAQHLFGLEVPLAFDVLLHLGSLLVVCVFFRRELKELFFGVLRRDTVQLRLFSFLVVATIPIVVLGLLFRDVVAGAFQNMVVVGLSLLFTALLLFLSRFPVRKSSGLSWPIVLVMGLFQAVALLPGVSRSGSTISAGLVLGVRREDAARFSFLLFIPAILGALCLELPMITAVDGVMVLGVVVSAVVGFFSLSLLMRIIKKGWFSWFALYCLVLGVLVLVL